MEEKVEETIEGDIFFFKRNIKMFFIIKVKAKETSYLVSFVKEYVVMLKIYEF